MEIRIDKELEKTVLQLDLMEVEVKMGEAALRWHKIHSKGLGGVLENIYLEKFTTLQAKYKKLQGRLHAIDTQDAPTASKSHQSDSG